MPSITLKNLKKEVTKLDIPESITTYTVLDAKKHLHDLFKTDSVSTDYKLIFQGKILVETDNLIDQKYYTTDIVYMKSTKKVELPVVKPQTQQTTPPPTTQNQPVGVPSSVVTQQPNTNEPLITPQKVAKFLVNSAVSVLLNNPQNLASFLMIDPNLKEILQSNPQLTNQILSMQFMTQLMNELIKYTGTVPQIPQGINVSITPIRMNNVSIPQLNPLQNDIQQNLQEQVVTHEQPPQETGPFVDWVTSLPQDLQQILSQFNREQKMDIMNLCSMGYNILEVIQLYPACGCDVNQTVERLNDQ
jgi:hypothetical protein